MKRSENVKLADHTTFKIGGVAKYFFEVGNETEILEVAGFAKENKLPIFVIGEGSDILVNDNGFDGIIVKYIGQDLEFKENNKKTLVTVEAGMVWDVLVEKCVEKGLQGIECMSGIPGTVGAAPIQNIGAYGQELKDTFVSLIAFNISDEKFVKFSKDECKFAYRESIFKSAPYWQKFIIKSVTLALSKNSDPDVKYESLKKYLTEKNISNPTLLEVRDSVLEIRKGKFEDYRKVPNAGSFFKNPVINSDKLLNLKKKYNEIPCFDNGDGTYKCFAGWFIEQAGWKGKRVGNAQVSTKHALILLNPDSKATAMEVKELAKEIIGDVDKIFGIKLETEVQYI